VLGSVQRGERHQEYGAQSEEAPSASQGGTGEGTQPAASSAFLFEQMSTDPGAPERVSDQSDMLEGLFLRPVPPGQSCHGGRDTASGGACPPELRWQRPHLFSWTRVLGGGCLPLATSRSHPGQGFSPDSALGLGSPQTLRSLRHVVFARPAQPPAQQCHRPKTETPGGQDRPRPCPQPPAGPAS
jgi:hypothetical protein